MKRGGSPTTSYRWCASQGKAHGKTEGCRARPNLRAGQNSPQDTPWGDGTNNECRADPKKIPPRVNPSLPPRGMARNEERE